MRIRKQLRREKKGTESTTTLSCEGISVDRGQCAKEVTEPLSWLGKRKRNKPSARHSDATKRDHATDVLLNNSLLVENSSACPANDFKSGRNSKIAPLKRKNTVESDKEAVQSQMKNNVAGFALSGDTNEAIQEWMRLNPAESTDISPDLEARCGSPIFSSRNICSSLQSHEKPVVAIDNKVAITSVEKCDEDEGVADVSSEMKLLRTNQVRGIKTYGRRKEKVHDSHKVNSKSIQGDTGSSVLTEQSRVGSTSSDHSVETLSGGCSKDGNKNTLVEEQGSLLQVMEDVRAEKVIDGCTDLECAVGENKGRMDMNNSVEKAAEVCFDKDKQLVDILEENIEQSKRANPVDVFAKVGEHGISLVGKVFDDESEKITPDKFVDSLSITLLSDLSNSRNDTTQDNIDMNLSIGRSLITSSRKKLLVLDLNGLLADIIRYVPDKHTPDGVISMKAVFKRPFYDDFLQFCFTRFSVGVWSSRAKRNVLSVVDFLMGDAKQKLLFCWDQSHCTETGFYTVENRSKPLFVKKLQKLWEKCEPDLPWERGEYNEANTLMLDDSPYKALHNPPHTAVFPHSYRHTNVEDDTLGPGGALRVYLEGLANAENVQKYVEENPFGQQPITEKNASWRFYQKVIEAITAAPENANNRCSTIEPDGESGIRRSGGDQSPASESLSKHPTSHDQRASDYLNRHSFSDTDGPDCGRGMQRRLVDRYPSYKTRDKRPIPHDERASDYPNEDSGIQRSGGDQNLASEALSKRPISHEQRACGYLNRHSFSDTDGPDCGRGMQKRRGDQYPAYKTQDKCPEPHDQRASDYSIGERWIQRSGGDRNPASEALSKRPISHDQRASDHLNRHSFSDTDGPDCGRGMQRRRVDLCPAYETLEKRPVPRDQRASDYPNWEGRIQRSGGDRNPASEALSKRPISHDQRASGYLNRNSFSDTDGPDCGRGMQRRQVDQYRAYETVDKCPVPRDQRASDYPNRHTWSNTDGPVWGRGIQRAQGDWYPAYKARDKRPVSYDQRVRDDPNRYTYLDSKGPDYGRRIRRWGGDLNPAYQDQDRHPVSYDQRASGYANGCSSFDMKGPDWGSGIQRGGGDWNATNQVRNRHPISYHQRAIDYPNGYSRVSFHWRAYQ